MRHDNFKNIREKKPAKETERERGGSKLEENGVL